MIGAVPGGPGGCPPSAMFLLGELLLLFLAPPPVCGTDPGEAERRALLAEANRLRVVEGLLPVRPHPALCQVARDRALEVAASGELEPSVSALQALTRAVYRQGYRPHAWRESSLLTEASAGEAKAVDRDADDGDADDGRVAGRGADRWPARSRGPTLLGRWLVVQPSLRELLLGDFEDAGVAFVSAGGGAAASLVVGLPKLTWERRLAAPLADLEAVRRAALAAANARRRAAGRGPLRADPRLDRAAQAHAEDMVRRGFYAHRGPEGSSPLVRARRAGYRGVGAVGENIAKGLFTPEEAVERWMNSSGHRRNLLRRGATATGFGVAVGDDGREVEVVWVQLVAGG